MSKATMEKFLEAHGRRDIQAMIKHGEKILEGDDLSDIRPFMALAVLTNLARAYAIAGSKEPHDAFGMQLMHMAKTGQVRDKKSFQPLGPELFKRSFSLALWTVKYFNELPDKGLIDPSFEKLIHTGLMPVDSVHWALKVIETLTPEVPISEISISDKEEIQKATKRAFSLWPNGPANPS